MAGRIRPDSGARFRGKRMEAKLNCGASTLKYILFVFNFVFLLGGIAVLVIGAVILASIGTYGAFLNNTAAVPGIMLVTAGSIIVIVCFLGCCGALRQSVWMLNTFAGFMIVIFIFQLIAGVLAFVFQIDLFQSMDTEMVRLMELYTNEADGELARKTWDEMQINLECCGIDSAGDWNVIAEINPPKSCQCFSGDDNCSPVGSFKDGCRSSLINYFESIQSALGIVALVFSGVELIGAIFALIVAYKIKRNSELPSYSGRGSSNPYNVSRRSFGDD